MIDQFARRIRLNTSHITRVDRLFKKWGVGLVLVGRMLPGIRTLVSIPAGLARMPFPVYFITTFIGSYVWCTIMVGLGYVVGHEWPLISAYIKQVLPFLVICGAAAIVLYLWMGQRSLAPAYLTGEDEDR